jgi:hypothetical protein
MLINVNFRDPLVISTWLCAIQAVCSVTNEGELPGARQQFLTPVVVAYLLTGLVYTDVCPLLCPRVPSHVDNSSERTAPRGGTYQMQHHVLCSLPSATAEGNFEERSCLGISPQHCKWEY